jgi:hypothetical protein
LIADLRRRAPESVRLSTGAIRFSPDDPIPSNRFRI